MSPGLLGAAALADGTVVLADGDRTWRLDGPLPGARLVWWRASTVAPALLAAGHRPAAVWDLGTVARLLHGGRRDDPLSVLDPATRVPEPRPGAAATLLDLDPDPDPRRPDGTLSPDWAAEPWAVRSEPGDVARAGRWAAAALAVQREQAAALAVLGDPRPEPVGVPLRLLTAYAESSAALLAQELAAGGLPVDRRRLEDLIAEHGGPRPVDEPAERDRRDREVLRHFRTAADLRHPAQVLAMLADAGITVPDTRSWRLEPHRGTSPGVAALLEWRKAERIATTYGWAWLDRCVGADDRLRGSWSPADAAAGRMTASNGLHNLPAELRPAVAARPGHVLVRADLGQVEPRVLAVVSGDAALAQAAAGADLYAPVAAALGCDRPTAKVAVLAAMYGQTSGTAGAALQRMERAYPRALAHLRAAEAVGRDGGELRTWGGRLLRLPGGGSGRGARNAVVQGAAAELFKVWAATVRAGLPALGGEVVLCLHDELLLHVPEQHADRAAALLTDALAQTAGRWATGTGVRLVADVAVVHRWSDAKGT